MVIRRGTFPIPSLPNLHNERTRLPVVLAVIARSSVMTEVRPITYPRRKAVAAGVGATLATVLGASGVDARLVLMRGVTGGGLAKISNAQEPGLANLSIFASALQLPEGDQAFVGQVHWVEAGTGLTLESTQITECVHPDGEPPGVRRVTGRMQINGQGDYPFVMRTLDDGPPGVGRDTIELEVNGATVGDEIPADVTLREGTYAASATLVAGDFQLLSYDMNG
jgi:hypothetical protein